MYDVSVVAFVLLLLLLLLLLLPLLFWLLFVSSVSISSPALGFGPAQATTKRGIEYSDLSGAISQSKTATDGAN